MKLTCTLALRIVVQAACSFWLGGIAIAANQNPPFTEVRGWIVDTEGVPLPAGTVVRGRVEWHWPIEEPTPLPGSRYGFQSIVIDADGRFVVPRADSWTDDAFTWWLHIERTLETGERERVQVPAHEEVGTVALEREVLLARIHAIDTLDAKVQEHAYSLEISAENLSDSAARDRLSARWVRKDEHRELWGYRVPGVYSIVACYSARLPSAPSVSLPLDGSDVTVVLPATGYAQLHIAAPRPFPENSLYFVIEDLERGIVQRRRLSANATTNVRLLLGPHRVHFELNGVALKEPEPFNVEHRSSHRVSTLDLTTSVRVFALDVVDPEGNPIPGASVRVVGSPDPPGARQRITIADASVLRWLVATSEERVDVEVSDHGFETQLVSAVTGDRVVVLKPAAR